jgi:exonuclease VII large subunit
MRRTALILAGLFLAIAQSPNFGIAPAQAQMDWLTPNLEAQRYNNMRRHQQRLRTNQQHMRSQRPTISPQRRQQLMRQIEPEYRRRVRLHGKARADEWLKRTAYRIGVEEGRRARRQLH